MKIENKEMTHYLKKYLILAIISALIVNISVELITSFVPNLLTTRLPNGDTHSFGTIYLERALDYIVNLFIVVLMYKDMKTLGLISIPILILTFLLNPLGIIFFLLVLANKYFTTNRMLPNERFL